VYTIEFVWPKAKPYTCSDPKPVRKSHVKEFKWSFNILKCDKIFDALLKDKIIRLTHTITSSNELRQCVYCKFHNSYSLVTNDCIVFHRQIQSAFSDRWLKLCTIAIDKHPFPMKVLDLEGQKVLVRPETTGSSNLANIVIGELESKEFRRNNTSKLGRKARQAAHLPA
jgi:hypothetical protein